MYIKEIPQFYFLNQLVGPFSEISGHEDKNAFDNQSTKSMDNNIIS